MSKIFKRLRQFARDWYDFKVLMITIQCNSYRDARDLWPEGTFGHEHLNAAIALCELKLAVLEALFE